MTAPTTTIETVTVVRPLKVIALICLIISVILLIVCLATTTWLKAGDFRTGLFEECSVARTAGATASPKLPKAAPPLGECQPVKYRGKVYIQATAALLVIAGIVTVIAIIMTILGLTTQNPNRKYLFYRVAMYLALIAVLFELIGLVVFPVCFYMELKDWGTLPWEFDWSYGVAWGAALFAFGSSLLLICDKEHEEIYYKEKTVYAAAPNEASASRV